MKIRKTFVTLIMTFAFACSLVNFGNFKDNIDIIPLDDIIIDEINHHR